MRLENIIKDSGVTEVKGRLDIDIKDVCDDSRKVSGGSLFIAVKGHGTDGHQYIGKAIEAGAAAIVFEEDSSVAPLLQNDNNVTFIKVASSRHALAIIAANFYDNPSRKLSLVGITGTNGKTTTVTLLYHLFMEQGYNCGLLSTIANYVGTTRFETANTTADPIVINSLMARISRLSFPSGRCSSRKSQTSDIRLASLLLCLFTLVASTYIIARTSPAPTIAMLNERTSSASSKNMPL